MALRWHDGFDTYDTSISPTTEGSVGENYLFSDATHFSIDQSGGRFGGGCVTFNTGSVAARFLRKELSGIGANLTVGFAVNLANPATLGTGTFLVGANLGTSSTQWSLIINPDGSLQAYRGNKTTSLGVSAAGVLVAATWAYVQVSVFTNDTTGTFVVDVDNTANVLNLSGIDTKGLSVPESNQIVFGMVTSGTKTTCSFDDMYIRDDLTRLGPCRVETISSVADTADKDFVASTGSDNFAMVDDLSITTDYVSSAVNGDMDLYEFGNLSNQPDDIYAVKAVSLAKSTEAGTRLMRNRVKSGASFGNGQAHKPTSTFRRQEDVFETDPDTAAAWTTTGVNAIKAGYEITA